MGGFWDAPSIHAGFAPFGGVRRTWRPLATCDRAECDPRYGGLRRTPLIGAWILDIDTSDDENPPTLAQFTSDGLYIQHDYTGADGVGAWEATGPATATMTFISYVASDEGDFGGGTIILASLEVGADGQRLAATYTLEVIAPAGSFGVQYGPGEATGFRIAGEPMGEPAGPLDDAPGGGGE